MDKGSDSDKSEQKRVNITENKTDQESDDNEEDSSSETDQESDDDEEDSSSETDQESDDDEEDSSSETDQESDDDDDGEPSNQNAAPPSARSKENEGETNQPSQQELYSRAIQLLKELSNDNLQTLKQDLFKMMKSQLSVRTVPDRHIRVASWNLANYNSSEVFWEKKHLVCETIKYHNFDIVALQEVGKSAKKSFEKGSAAIIELKKELGEDWGIVHTEDEVGKIKQKMGEYGAFLYNKSRNIKCASGSDYLKTLPLKFKSQKPSVKSTSETPSKGSKPPTKQETECGRNATVAEFTKQEKSVPTCIELISVHLNTKKKECDEQIQLIKCLKIQSKFPIILGDFNVYLEDIVIQSTKYKNILKKKEYTNTKGNKSYDGILVPQKFYENHESKWKFGITYGVGDIAEKGGFLQRHISDHKPIWVDISIDDIIDYCTSSDHKSESPSKSKPQATKPDCKCEIAEDKPEKTKENISEKSKSYSDDKWIPSLDLTKEHEKILKNSKEWVDDSIINAGQELLKRKYPKMGSLQKVAVGVCLDFKKVTKKFVQILYSSSPSHWLCVTNIACRSGEVRVLDSSTPSPKEIIPQITQLVKTGESQLKLLYLDVASQPDGDSCGLYALANATALCAGKDPTTIMYNHDEMRSHLYKCFVNNSISPFPRNSRSVTKAIKKIYKPKMEYRK